MPSVCQLNTWRSKINRQTMVSRIEESIKETGVPIQLTAVEMENLVFKKVKSREQYMNIVARILLNLRRIALHEKGHPEPDHVIARLTDAPESNGQRGVNTEVLSSLQNLGMQ